MNGPIAEVVFDLPLHRAFAYLVPPAVSVARGQRVRAPLQGRARVGMVVDLREGDATGLLAIQSVSEPVPIFSRAALELTRWVADESLSSWGSTALALLPPLPARGAAETLAPPPEGRPAAGVPPELWMAARRADRLVDLLAREPSPALVIAPDIESAARWARRLDAARLDSGIPGVERRAAWFAASRGRARIVVGTRSALLTPLPPPAMLVLLDEHDTAHKPPGAPRLHTRDVLLRRAALEGSRLLLLSATPSVESWWRAEDRQIRASQPEPGPWPEVLTADTRGILRNHPLTLPLTRAIEELSRRGRQVALVITRGAAALACDECGSVLRCPECGVALALSRAERTLSCRVCARGEPLPEGCPCCGGHRLSPLGWGAERVEAAVRRRFPRLSVSRSDPGANVVVGTAALLGRLGPGSVGCVGFVDVDGLLRVPDFRAGERAFEILWTAAERVGGAGRIIVQTRHPQHYAIRAVREQDRAAFYKNEMRFRAELGYPPFRRLCVVSTRDVRPGGGQALIGECAERLRGLPDVTVYGAVRQSPAAVARARWRAVIKGPPDLPRLLDAPLRPFLERRRRGSAVVEVEMDPVSLS